MVKPLGAGAAYRSFTAGLGNQVFPLLGGASPEQFGNPPLGLRLERRIVQGTVVVGQAFGIPGGDTGGLDKLPEVLVAGAAESHPLIVLAVEDAAPKFLQGGNRRSSVVYSHPESADGLEHAVEQWDFDSLAHTVALPCVQGHDDGHHRLECPVGGGDGYCRVNRPVALIVGRAKRGRRCADYPLIGRHLRPGIIGSEPGNGAVNQTGVGLGHGFRAQPQTLHHARPKILQDYVGGLDERLGRRQIIRLLQVQQDTALAPVPGRVGRSLPDRPPWRVNLDNISTLVGQQHPGQRPGNILPKVDYSDSI